MIPAPWIGMVLALATYRITRLIGWDDLPPIANLRNRITGAREIKTKLTNDPSYWIWRRPLLAHFLGCAFCQGFWVSLLAYIAWLAEPRWALYAAAPLALSGAVGLIAKNLDP